MSCPEEEKDGLTETLKAAALAFLSFLAAGALVAAVVYGMRNL